MKKTINKFIVVVMLFAGLSCQDTLDINTSPNASTTANIQQVLTSGQIYLTDLQSSIGGETVLLWAQ